ncbi:MAG: hypothetical protein J6S23_00930 [Clostridia bacterium]|nr:hypothetical protein [Clostridia bacterium]
MKYYKQLNENGEIVALLTYDFEPNIIDPLTVEITAEEYETISTEWGANEKHEPSAEQIERRERQKAIALKAKAYDIITGVSE